MTRRLILSTVATLIAAVAVFAQETRDIDVTVRLREDGSARVEQIWDVTVTSGTEWYVPVSNLGDRYIHDLSVKEGDIVFESDGRRWNSDRSLKEKTHRCGIIEKRGGDIEICWGQGPYGDHVYEVSYTIDNLVQSLNDCDAFIWQFLNDEWSVCPKHVTVRIVNESSVPWKSTDTDDRNVGAWGFGFYGTLDFIGNTMIAESTEPFRYDSSVIIMMQFHHGIYSPATAVDMDFADMRDRAFSGSNYSSGDEKSSLWDWSYIIVGFILAALFVVPVLLALLRLLRKMYLKSTGKVYRKEIFGKNKIDSWYREIPIGGSVTGAYSLLMNGELFTKPEKEISSLIGAYFLKWIESGTIRVERDPRKETRMNLAFVKDSAELSFDDAMERMVYDRALEAAGSNKLLEANEFKTWSTKHFQAVSKWPQKAKSEGRPVWSSLSMEDRCKVVEFRNFLKDFTLSEDREAPEVGLWKQYLVFAQVFGIADQVMKNFEKLFPAQFQEFIRQNNLMDNNSLYFILRNVNSSANSMMSSALNKKSSVDAAAQARRSGGGGGFSSFGGGGGFSGGGHGGGSR